MVGNFFVAEDSEEVFPITLDRGVEFSVIKSTVITGMGNGAYDKTSNLLSSYPPFWKNFSQIRKNDIELGVFAIKCD